MIVKVLSFSVWEFMGIQSTFFVILLINTWQQPTVAKRIQSNLEANETKAVDSTSLDCCMQFDMYLSWVMETEGVDVRHRARATESIRRMSAFLKGIQLQGDASAPEQQVVMDAIFQLNWIDVKHGVELLNQKEFRASYMDFLFDEDKAAVLLAKIPTMVALIRNENLVSLDLPADADRSGCSRCSGSGVKRAIPEPAVDKLLIDLMNSYNEETAGEFAKLKDVEEASRRLIQVRMAEINRMEESVKGRSMLGLAGLNATQSRQDLRDECEGSVDDASKSKSKIWTMVAKLVGSGDDIDTCVKATRALWALELLVTQLCEMAHRGMTEAMGNTMLSILLTKRMALA